MAKYEFKVGDRVQFKEWDEMGKEFGFCTNGVNTMCSFREEMRHLCGTYATIADLIPFAGHHLVILCNFTTTGDTCWNITPDMLKPASTKKQTVDEPKKLETTYPTITAHVIEGKKTTVMLSDGRIGEVTCYYKDTFDPAVGVAEAYQKALGITKAEDKPKPKFEIGKKYVLPAVQGGRKEVVIEISNIDDRTGVYTCRIFDHDVYLSFRENGEFYNALIPYTDATVKEVKRVAKVGEWIKLTDPKKFHTPSVSKDDVFKVISVHSNSFARTPSGNVFRPQEYVVLEGYRPDKSIVKEVKRPANIGEYVKVVNASLNIGYRNGDILKVILKNFNVIKADNKGKVVTVWHKEYVVLEGYDPDIHGKI